VNMLANIALPIFGLFAIPLGLVYLPIVLIETVWINVENSMRADSAAPCYQSLRGTCFPQSWAFLFVTSCSAPSMFFC
jgi:hypothetical protein